jgi:hypothetical protein
LIFSKPVAGKFSTGYSEYTRKVKATWFVVPGSGTGEGYFGKGSDATLDYWFE